MNTYFPFLFALYFFLTINDLSAQIAKVPFEFDGKHMLIKVDTKNQTSLRFVFDTGTTGAAIDSAAARNAGIYNDTLTKVIVDGSGGSQAYSMALHQNIQIENLAIKNINLVLTDFRSLSEALGTKIDGIIGYEILNQYITQIDFDQQLLCFYQKNDAVDTAGYTSIKFEFNKNILIPRFPISITLDNGETFSGKVMFDTGNAFSLLVSTPFNKFHHLSQKLGEIGITGGRGANTITQDQVAHIKSMEFNGFRFSKMSIRLTVNNQAEARDGYLGILGSQIIQRFHVILDYGHMKIYLKPNESYNEPFTLEKIPGSSNAESKEFLDKNAKKPGVHITLSGLQYKVIKRGTGAIPVLSDKVSLHYSTKLVNGRKLWSTYESNKPWVHHLDKALPGLSEAVLLMPVGSKWKIYIPASLAFGDDGDKDIPAGAALIYDVELIAIQK